MEPDIKDFPQNMKYWKIMNIFYLYSVTAWIEVTFGDEGMGRYRKGAGRLLGYW